MKVRFWGTRGSIAKPGPSTIRYGGNTSCVEVRSDSGCIIVIDCGTGAHDLGQSLVRAGQKPCSGHILISHTHWDHIQGLPFFAPLFSPGNEWHIYGPRGLGTSLREVLAGQMEYAYFPVSLNAFAAAIHYHEVVEGAFRVGDFRVTAQYLNHPALTVGYRLESDGATVVYASDHEPHHHAAGLDDVATLRGGDALHRDFVRDADLLIHDAQYTAAEYPNKIGWGHSTVEYVTDIAVTSKVRHLALYHHDPMRDDDAVDNLVRIARGRAEGAETALRVSAAAEGATIELRGPTQTNYSQEGSSSGLADLTNDLSRELVMIAGVAASESAMLMASARAEGVSSVALSSADEALASIKQRWPSLILLGADFPGDPNDPVVLCERIRALPNARSKETPIIVLTDDVRLGVVSSKAVTEWLQRPFSMQYARARIRAWLTRSICRWRRADVPRPVTPPPVAALRQRSFRKRDSIYINRSDS